MEIARLVAQENLSLIVPLVFVSMIVVYGISKFRYQRAKQDKRKEQEMRRIFY